MSYVLGGEPLTVAGNPARLHEREYIEIINVVYRDNKEPCKKTHKHPSKEPALPRRLRTVHVKHSFRPRERSSSNNRAGPAAGGTGFQAAEKQAHRPPSEAASPARLPLLAVKNASTVRRRVRTAPFHAKTIPGQREMNSPLLNVGSVRIAREGDDNSNGREHCGDQRMPYKKSCDCNVMYGKKAVEWQSLLSQYREEILSLRNALKDREQQNYDRHRTILKGQRDKQNMYDIMQEHRHNTQKLVRMRVEERMRHEQQVFDRLSRRFRQKSSLIRKAKQQFGPRGGTQNEAKQYGGSKGSSFHDRRIRSNNSRLSECESRNNMKSNMFALEQVRAVESGTIDYDTSSSSSLSLDSDYETSENSKHLRHYKNKNIVKSADRHTGRSVKAQSVTDKETVHSGRSTYVIRGKGSSVGEISENDVYPKRGTQGRRFNRQPSSTEDCDSPEEAESNREALERNYRIVSSRASSSANRLLRRSQEAPSRQIQQGDDSASKAAKFRPVGWRNPQKWDPSTRVMSRYPDENCDVKKPTSRLPRLASRC